MISGVTEIFNIFFIENEKDMDFYEKNIVKIILFYIKDIQKTSYYYGKRQNFIVNRIKWVKDNKFPVSFDKVQDNNSEEIVRLIKLKVKNFRGFRSEFEFDLSKKFIFLYGRNGTGKSSFSEALEYSLLNSIEESNSKRIDLSEYIKNAYSNKFDKPVLIGENKDLKNVKVEPSSNYHFCVIERNRIENFARLSAETANIQQERLAALVGLDRWNAFVHNFSKDIDKKLDFKIIDRDKRYEYYIIKKRLETEILECKKNMRINEEKVQELIDKYGEDSIDATNKKITENISKIQEKNSSGKNNKIDIDLLNKYIKLVKKVKEKISVYEEENSELLKYKENISLTKLSHAILSVQSNFKNECPACLSTIYDEDGNLLLKSDPYTRSNNEISKFEDNYKLEEKLTKKGIEIDEGIKNLKENEELIEKNGEKVTYEGLKAFCQSMDGNNNTWDYIKKIDIAFLKNLVCDMEKYNQSVEDTHFEKIDLLYKERNALENLGKSLGDNKKELDKLNNSIKETIFDFYKFSIKQGKAVSENQMLKKYGEAYKKVVKKLNNFTNGLPIKELSNLDDKICEIYNELCKNDDNVEHFETIKLPSASNSPIEITLKGKSGSFNALGILSEGHIRVLGLSILLAKAYADNLKFIIFDDVVNSIDDDHRQAIADFVTNSNGIFKDVQWIITTHGPEFQKQLVSRFSSKNDKKDTKEIKLLPKDETGDIRVGLDDTVHFINRAKSFFEQDEMRDCITNCRREIEVFMVKLWKLYKKRYNKDLSFVVSLTNPIINTRNAMDVLKKAFDGIKDTDDKEILTNLTDLLDKLLGPDQIYWNLMNKGTHQEDGVPEFDRAEVRDLLYTVLQPLDKELTDILKVKNNHFVRVVSE